MPTLFLSLSLTNEHKLKKRIKFILLFQNLSLVPNIEQN